MAKLHKRVWGSVIVTTLLAVAVGLYFFNEPLLASAVLLGAIASLFLISRANSVGQKFYVSLQNISSLEGLSELFVVDDGEVASASWADSDLSLILSLPVAFAHRRRRRQAIYEPTDWRSVTLTFRNAFLLEAPAEIPASGLNIDLVGISKRPDGVIEIATGWYCDFRVECAELQITVHLDDEEARQSIFTVEEEQAVYDVVSNRIGTDEFESKMPFVAATVEQFVHEGFETTFFSRNRSDVEALLLLALTYKVPTANLRQIYTKLLTERFHMKHSDILGILREYETEELVDLINGVIDAKFAYLAWDDNFALEVRCIHMLGRIGGLAAREKLEELTSSPDEPIKRAAEKQLSRL